MRFTTFSSQSAGTELLRMVALYFVAVESILCHRLIQQLHSGKLFNCLANVPLLDLSRRTVRLFVVRSEDALSWRTLLVVLISPCSSLNHT